MNTKQMVTWLLAEAAKARKVALTAADPHGARLSEEMDSKFEEVANLVSRLDVDATQRK